jgi:hypothetical protein
MCRLRRFEVLRKRSSCSKRCPDKPLATITDVIAVYRDLSGETSRWRFFGRPESERRPSLADRGAAIAGRFSIEHGIRV